MKVLWNSFIWGSFTTIYSGFDAKKGLFTIFDHWRETLEKRNTNFPVKCLHAFLWGWPMIFMARGGGGGWELNFLSSEGGAKKFMINIFCIGSSQIFVNSPLLYNSVIETDSASWFYKTHCKNQETLHAWHITKHRHAHQIHWLSCAVYSHSCLFHTR